MKRERLLGSDSVTVMMTKMSEGNPGAATVLLRLMDKGSSGEICIFFLSLMNIRGSQIWRGYKDFAAEDLNVFMNAVKRNDSRLVEVINAEACPDDQQAIVRGRLSKKDLESAIPHKEDLNNVWIQVLMNEYGISFEDGK